jgi:hypothetical protein
MPTTGIATFLPLRTLFTLVSRAGLNCISSPKVAKASTAINTSSIGQGKQST